MESVPWIDSYPYGEPKYDGVGGVAWFEPSPVLESMSMVGLYSIAVSGDGVVGLGKAMMPDGDKGGLLDGCASFGVLYSAKFA